MSQSSSNWDILLKVGAPFLAMAGAYAVFVFKKHTDQMEYRINNLSYDKKELQQSLQKVEAEKEQAIDNFLKTKNILENIRDRGLDSVTPEQIEAIKTMLGAYENFASSQAEMEDYRPGAKWLKHREEDWVQEACRAAIKEYPKLVLRKTRKQFHQEISSYLNWVYESLYIYGQPSGALGTFVRKPIIKDPMPYVAAIRHVRDNRDRGELTLDESRHLENMLDELIRQINYEFRNL